MSTTEEIAEALDDELAKHKVYYSHTATSVTGQEWSRWACSCGAQSSFRPTTDARLRAAAGRHLWAVEKRVRRELHGAGRSDG